MSVKQENRRLKWVIETGRAATDRQLAHGLRARVAVLAGEEAPANTDAY